MTFQQVLEMCLLLMAYFINGWDCFRLIDAVRVHAFVSDGFSTVPIKLQINQTVRKYRFWMPVYVLYFSQV